MPSDGFLHAMHTNQLSTKQAWPQAPVLPRVAPQAAALHKVQGKQHSGHCIQLQILIRRP